LQPDKHGTSAFDCTSCQRPQQDGGMALDVRRSWHCGWLEREEWSEPYAFAADNLFDGAFTMPDGSQCDVCPGYLAELPQMKEAARATWALRKNVMATYYPAPPAVLLDAVEIIDGAFSAYEAKQIELARAK
jgi:hypothetical protein